MAGRGFGNKALDYDRDFTWTEQKDKDKEDGQTG
jgi:hypothetical protein